MTQHLFQLNIIRQVRWIDPVTGGWCLGGVVSEAYFGDPYATVREHFKHSILRIPGNLLETLPAREAA